MLLSFIDPTQYTSQLQKKVQRLRHQFMEFNPPVLEIYESAPLHYRQRAEFRIWHEGEHSYYVMFHPGQRKTPIRITDFSPGSLLLNKAMKAIMIEVISNDVLRRKLFQVEFLTTLSNQTLVSMIYHRPLDDEWYKHACVLHKTLGMNIIGRSKKQKLVVGKDWITECLTIAGKTYHYQQIENSFTQPNAIVNQKMLEWALAKTTSLGGDLLELYCGNGNFTVVLAQNFSRVLATEINKISVKSAQYNLSINHINNVDLVRMSSEDLSAAMQNLREFRRLKNIDLNDFQFSTVMVDPPRAGLDKQTEKIVARFDNILYISCNPDTLHSNLKNLFQSHSIEHFALFDQFPYTDHVECGVVLKKR